MFLGHMAARQAGVNSLSQGPAMGGSSHKTLYMSQQERMQEIGKVYNYQGETSLANNNITSAANIKI